MSKSKKAAADLATEAYASSKAMKAMLDAEIAKVQRLRAWINLPWWKRLFTPKPE